MALGAVLISLWLMLLAVPASAHDSLIESDPADGEVLTEPPGEIVLTFSGEISDLGAQFMVTGPEGRDVVQGTPTIEGPTVTQELADELTDGDYEIAWRVTSSDGHPISGTIAFALEAEGSDGGEGEESTQAPTTDPEPGATGADPSTEPSSETDPGTDPGATSAPEEASDPAESTSADSADPGTDEDQTEVTAAAAETTDGESSGGIPAWGWLVAAVAAIGLVACGFLAFRRN